MASSIDSIQRRFRPTSDDVDHDTRHDLRNVEASENLGEKASRDALAVEVIKQAYHAFDDFEAVPIGGSCGETQDVSGCERGRRQ